MTDAAKGLLDSMRAELAPRDNDNRLVPAIAAGTARRAVFAAFAAEERLITRSDQRSLYAMAARADEPQARAFFGALAPGELQAFELLDALCTAAGPDQGAVTPRAGCQAYPAYIAWLALNGESAAVVASIFANFAAFGGYCRAVAAGMRAHYGFDDAACAFFDFFAAEVPEIERLALAAVQSGLDSGRLDPAQARHYARLFLDYELMFWNTLADEFITE